MGIEYLQYAAIKILAQSLPRRIVYRMSDSIADVFFAFDTCARPAIRSNLRRILSFKGEQPSEPELNALVRRVFHGSARNLVEFFHFKSLTQRDIAKLFRIEGLDHLTDCLAQGKGVLAFSAHYGCFEMSAAVVASLGYPTNIVALPYHDPRAEALFASQRLRWGLKVIPQGKAARGCFDALRRGEILAVVGDFDFSLRDERIPFLGAPMRMPFGIARMALKTRAPILPAFTIPLHDGNFRLRFYEPIIPEEGTSLQQLQARLVRILETVVLEYPHYWLLFSDVWDAAWSLEIARDGSPRHMAAAKRRAHGTGTAHPRQAL